MEKLEMLLEKEEFMDKMLNAESIDELGALLSENGVEMDREELKAFAEEGKKEYELDAAEGELDEELLENVSGGGLIKWIKKKLNDYGRKKGEELDRYWEKLIYSYWK